MTEYLIGTGGWSYFRASNRSSLKTYSEHFRFVEVNSAFYEYPSLRTVERWRRLVPVDFQFSVRCHQDLTHRIGLKPVDQAFEAMSRMIAICRVLEAPFLHLLTPKQCALKGTSLRQAQDFFSSVNLKGIRLAWEIRGPATAKLINLLRDMNITHSVDLSRETPAWKSDAIYTRLFGKGKHNIYQFTDEELEDIDQEILKSKARVAMIAYHGVRMHSDALRFKSYKDAGTFLPLTTFTGIDSARHCLQEDARFPSTKAELIEHQGWKVIDLTTDKRIHISELLSKLPEKTYCSVAEVVEELGASL